MRAFGVQGEHIWVNFLELIFFPGTLIPKGL